MKKFKLGIVVLLMAAFTGIANRIVQQISSCKLYKTPRQSWGFITTKRTSS